MSTYNWESGTIIIPTDQYRGFRKSMIEAWNKREEAILKLAEGVYTAIKEKRLTLTADDHDGYSDAVLRYLEARGHNEETAWRIHKMLFMKSVPALPPQDPSFGNFQELKKPLSPKKKSIKLLPISKGATLEYDECCVAFDDKEHALRWVVNENNHAVERAHEHPFTRTLFQALSHINWKRGSGGKIVGNDEYNRDNANDGGGANYVTRSFGPNEKSERQNTYGGGFGHGFMGGPRR